MHVTSVLMLAAAAQGSLCDRMAATVRAGAASPGSFHRALKAANGLLAPAITDGETVKVSDAFEKQLADTYPDASQEGVAQVERVGPLWHTSWVQGTLHCASDGFFTRDAGGAIHKLPAPAAYSDLCWTSQRDLGTVFGKAALIENDGQEHPYLGEDVIVTPWQSGWQPACGLRVRYDDRFVLTERFCDDRSICAAGAALAPRHAPGVGRGDDAKQLQALAAPPPATMRAKRAAFAASKTMSELGEDGALPTFGETPKTEFPDYSSSTGVLVVVNGVPLIARVGIGGVGWREIGDYLVALYRFGVGKPVPVASYVVERRMTGLRSVGVFAPKPYENDR